MSKKVIRATIEQYDGELAKVRLEGDPGEMIIISRFSMPRGLSRGSTIYTLDGVSWDHDFVEDMTESERDAFLKDVLSEVDTDGTWDGDEE